jgi:hypothetical protein
MRIKIQKYYRITPYWRTDRVYRKVQQIVGKTVDSWRKPTLPHKEMETVLLLQ